MVHVTILVST